jgi:hypothetical protein
VTSVLRVEVTSKIEHLKLKMPSVYLLSRVIRIWRVIELDAWLQLFREEHVVLLSQHLMSLLTHIDFHSVALKL